ncbi:uncharacterized protein LOC118404205 [Branchiostoma floridae]|uniref:Uncharacterized protein LOC118404205 n=1 Tax=Branchiostoma floridae TaxID=7739 RepID=A0A9J7HGC0_BRAFL|nr:uncharacterized protein LOC118404205 [Branchiostoma floridae]
MAEQTEQTLTRTEQFWQWWNSGVPKVDLPKKYGLQYSEKEFAYENLVLKGGGAKGIAYIGACQALKEAGILPNIKRFAGTSAGAITATLLAIGMSPEQMLQELSEKNLMDLKDPPRGWWRSMNKLPHVRGVPSWLTVDMVSMASAAFKERGMFEGKDFYDWFGDVLERNLRELHPDKRGMNKDITFDKLHRVTGKELCIVAYNMVLGSEAYFHVKTTPMIKIRDAVRMSMSIPVAFQPFEGYGFPKFTFIDGGLVANYPLWAFDGWYLSDKEEHTFKKMLSMQDEAKISRMFHPEHRKKERFDTRNDKTLGILMFSRKDPELYQEQFEERLRKLVKAQPDFEKEQPQTELYKKYKKKMSEQDDVGERAKQMLKKLVGEHIKGLYECIEDDNVEGAREHLAQIFTEKNLDIVNVRSPEEAMEMMDGLLMDEDGNLTTEMLKKIEDNVGPLQLAKGKYLKPRLVSEPRDYFDTILKFVGNNSGIEV